MRSRYTHLRKPFSCYHNERIQPTAEMNACFLSLKYLEAETHVFYLKWTNLYIQWKIVKSHWTKKSYLGANVVSYGSLIYPNPLKLGENVLKAKIFQMFYQQVRQPQLIDEAFIHSHRNPLFLWWTPRVRSHDKSGIFPHYVQISNESDTEVVVINIRNVHDIYS